MDLFQDTRTREQGRTYIPLFRLPGALSEFLAADSWTGSANVIGGYAYAATAVHDTIALILRAETSETGRLKTSAIIPPYLFLWRHHMELSLKQCLQVLVNREQSYLSHGQSEWHK